MKILQLSVSLFLLTFTTVSAGVNIKVKDSSLEKLITLESFKISKNLIVSDSLPKVNKIIICPFLTDIDQVTANKMDEFIARRLGVISSVTNISSKKITVTVDANVLNDDLKYLFDSVKVKFLSEIDKPIIKQH